MQISIEKTAFRLIKITYGKAVNLHINIAWILKNVIPLLPPHN